MFTVTKALEEALLQHFIYTKLKIAYAINKPFPFFEALRDNCFITERKYKESLEAFQNLVPLSKVVHNILTSLEQTFHPSMLLTLFSQINLREYPMLVEIFQSFKNVGAAYGGNKRPAQTLLKAPSDPAEGCSFQTLLPLPPPQPSPPSHLPSTPRVCEPLASSQKMTEILDERPSPSHPAGPPLGFIQEGKTTPADSNNSTATADKEEDSERMPSIACDPVQTSSRDPQRNPKDDSPEMPHSPAGPVPVISDNVTSKTEKEEEESSGEQPLGSRCAEQGVKDDSPASNDLEMPPEAASTPANKKAKKRKRCIWSTTKRRHQKKRPPQGMASPGHGVQEKPTVERERTQKRVDSTRNAKMVTRTQRARTGRAPTSRSQGKSKGDAVDFLSLTLPVTCGQAKGILFKEKMIQNSSGKFIQNEAGDWVTAKEFLIEGKKAKSRNWKEAILCKEKTLRFLEQKGLLFRTPKSNLKKRVTSSK